MARRKFGVAERVAISASVVAGLTGAALIIGQLVPSSESAPEADKPGKPPLPGDSTSYSPSPEPLDSSSPSSSPSAQESSTSPANADPWASLRQQLALPFGSCVVRSFTNAGELPEYPGKTALHFSDTSFVANSANMAARNGRRQGQDGVSWSETTLTAALATPGTGLNGRSYGAVANKHAPNGAPTDVYGVFPRSAASDVLVVISAQTTSTSRNTAGQVVTTTEIVPCGGDSQLSFQNGAWRPVADNQMMDLPPAIETVTVG